MPYGTITSTENTFGTVNGALSGTVAGTLSGSVGVPGQQGATGATGATGAQGPQGDPGEGVPVGGSAGQVLAKIDGTNYNTEWVNVEGDYLPLAGGAMDANASITASDTGTDTDSELAGWGLGVQLSADHTKGTTVEFNGLDTYDGASHMQVTPTGITFPDSSVQSVAYPGDGRPLTDYDFTNVADTKLTGFGMTLQGYTTSSGVYNSSIDADTLTLEIDYSNYGTAPGFDGYTTVNALGVLNVTQTWSDDGEGNIVSNGGSGFWLTGSGLTFNSDAGNPSPSSVQYLRSQITFGNGSVQTIAFPGFTGYAPLASPAFTGNPTAPTPATSDNDTSIATTAYVKAQAFGDRYLTTSTTSNTISNTTKTFTIGTDLSYTPTQNITISYDAGNHMHGEVLTYSTSTGVLTVDINHHTGSGTYAAWVVNVGGVTPATSVAWGDITGTLSTQTDLQNALNLKANLASPTFTGTPSLPTGTTGITQSPGNNTTALATTAFVTAAVPAFATNAQAVAGTSATVSLNPVNGLIAQMNTATVPTLASSLNAAQTAGSSSAFVSGATFLANGTSTGYVSRSCGSFIRGGSTSTGINWTRPVAISARIGGQTAFQTQCVYRLNIGSSTSVLGTPAVRSIGVRFGASATSVLSALVLEVHDGTTLSSVTTSFTPTLNQIFDVAVYSDGAGNAYCYVNGSQVGSSSGAPSTAASGGQNIVQVGLENVTTPTATSTGVLFNLKFLVN